MSNNVDRNLDSFSGGGAIRVYSPGEVGQAAVQKLLKRRWPRRQRGQRSWRFVVTATGGRWRESRPNCRTGDAGDGGAGIAVCGDLAVRPRPATQLPVAGIDSAGRSRFVAVRSYPRVVGAWLAGSASMGQKDQSPERNCLSFRPSGHPRGLHTIGTRASGRSAHRGSIRDLCILSDGK